MAEGRSRSCSSRLDSSRASSSQDSQGDRGNLRVVVLEAKSIYRYTIPSFCAITMNLQRVTLECLTAQDEKNFDGYIRVEGDRHRINRCLPACVRIVSACIVPVSYPTCIYGLLQFLFHTQEAEFSLEISTENLKLGPSGVFVIYEWEWEDGTNAEMTYEKMRDCSYSSQQSCSSPSPSPSPHPLDNLAISSSSIVTHVIVFKCIGAVRDEGQQKALEQAFIARQNGETVPVKIEPEPTNPYDSKAICFKCLLGGMWCRIGYIVRALDEVHEAIRNERILWVRFAWVKFLLHWTRSGPGFYAGINIARIGEWSDRCVRSASTK